MDKKMYTFSVMADEKYGAGMVQRAIDHSMKDLAHMGIELVDFVDVDEKWAEAAEGIELID